MPSDQTLHESLLCKWNTPLTNVDLLYLLSPIILLPSPPQEEEIVDTSVFCNMLLENDFQFRKTFAEDMSVGGVAVSDESEEIQRTGCHGVAMEEFARESLPKLLRASSLALG